MRLLLLRHGRTTAAPGTLVGSRIDPGLSEQGRQQAHAAAALVRDRPLAAAICSPLLRARETAALALPETTTAIDARLQELDWGEITGLTFPQVEQRFPEVAAAWLRDGWPAPPGGEHPRALWRRTATAVLDLHRAHSDGDVLIVCHGGVIRAIVGAARGLSLGDAWRIRTPHASLRIQRATPLAVQRWRAVLEVP
ncbi:MAG TPA: histidine phosphatase family protein [Candidatus Dormibacteraeota bacterium]|jgi:probable phosphoglycerate mutase|nr:histidine phosphatase family protein [Candidatus Dormibacteraeota bacterium]